jgi:hypothetical protein
MRADPAIVAGVFQGSVRPYSLPMIDIEALAKSGTTAGTDAGPAICTGPGFRHAREYRKSLNTYPGSVARDGSIEGEDH